METIKSYTDLFQSEVLSKILPLESADACWTNHLFGSFLSSWRIESTPPQKYKLLLDRFVVKGYLVEPAWSLAALLSTLTENKICHYKDRYYCQYMNEGDEFPIYSTAEYDNPVDACYEMILKLHELNLL